jgi:transglutaminase-like putative cysteine protease
MGTTERATRERMQIAWAAAAILFGGAPHMLSVVPWVPAFVIVIAVWRVAAAVRGWSLAPLWLRAPLTLLGFMGVAISYRSVSGVEAGSALLLVMAGMKLLETRTERDRVLVVLIAYFLLFAAFLREQAIWSLAWLVCGAFGVTVALAQTMRRERLLSLGAAGALSARLTLQGLPLAALLFLLFPRIPGPFWALPPAKQAAVSGLTEEVRPGDITELGLSDEVAFRVRFDGAVPPPGALYWRGPVLERFDGRTWAASASAGRIPTRTQSPAARQFDYQMMVEPHGKRWLLALETPVRWSMPRASLSEELQLLSPEPLGQRVSYRARSAASSVGAAEASSRSLSLNLRLPEGRNPRTRNLARELRRASSDDRAFLARSLQVFRDAKFYYSLSPPPLGADPVDEFLFSTREGFCEHFASALAALARAGGVPARVVVGYQGAERNPLGDYWIVRQANAHAWVEVWLDGAWRRVDPTAAVAPERIERGIGQAFVGSARITGRLWRTNVFVNRLVLSWDAVHAAWNRWVLAYGPEMQEDLLFALGFEVPRTFQLAGLAAVAIVVCLAMMAVAMRRRRAVPRDPGARLYAQLCRRLAGAVRPRAAAETALHYADAVAAARPDLGPAVRKMTDLYLRLRYGIGEPDLEQRLAQMITEFRPGRAPVRA